MISSSLLIHGDRRPQLLLAFCASVGLIASKREADDLPVDNKQVNTGQDKFLPTPENGALLFQRVPGSTGHGKSPLQAGEGR